jgi:hypothetical protein
LNFAKRFLKAQPDLQFAGGFDVSSYPSKQADKPYWNGYEVLDAQVNKEMKQAREQGRPWKVYFVGQSGRDRHPIFGSTDTTYLKVVDRSGQQQKVVPNADIDLLNRLPWQLFTREKDRP